MNAWILKAIGIVFLFKLPFVSFFLCVVCWFHLVVFSILLLCCYLITIEQKKWFSIVSFYWIKYRSLIKASTVAVGQCRWSIQSCGFTCAIKTKMHSKWQVLSSNSFRTRFLLIVSSVASISIYTVYQIGSEFISRNQPIEVYSVNDTANKSLEAKTCFLSMFESISNQSVPHINFDSKFRNENIILFEDVFEAKKQPEPDRSIFFIESSCVRNGLAALNAR